MKRSAKKKRPLSLNVIVLLVHLDDEICPYICSVIRIVLIQNIGKQRYRVRADAYG